jgi:hypothetical protein
MNDVSQTCLFSLRHPFFGSSPVATNPNRETITLVIDFDLLRNQFGEVLTDGAQRMGVIAGGLGRSNFERVG